VCLIVLNAFAYKTQYEFCKFHVMNGKLRGWETCVVKGTLQIGIRAKVSTLSLDGPVERSLDRECEGKLSREDQFRTLGCFEVSRGHLTSISFFFFLFFYLFIKNSGSLAVQ
jgi:hypothetical protein